MTQFNSSEIFVRNDAVVTDIDEKERIVELIAVPWDQEAKVPWRGELWDEVFRRGAFKGLEGHAGRVMVNREHVKGDTVGIVRFADPSHSEGLFIRAWIPPTTRGEDTLILSENGMLQPSIGYKVMEKDDIKIHHRTRLREVLRAFLDHLSLVEAPAFAGAQVLAVREEQSELTEPPPPGTRALDEAWSHPAYQWALERLTSK